MASSVKRLAQVVRVLISGIRIPREILGEG